MSRGTIPDLDPTHPNTLMSTSQVAEFLGVPRSTVARWAKSGRLPRPRDTTPASPIWLRSKIEKFKDELDAEQVEREDARAAAVEAARS